MREHVGIGSSQGDALHIATRWAVPPDGLAFAASGINRGFWESYKADIAAYEIDKLLKMDMVPPSVERQIQGITGAAQLWVENIILA